jgi:regulator of replication initiation timing
MEAKIKGMVDLAETRMVKENVRSFAAARQSLKKDIHMLREENAALKAEVKNLKAMAGAVSGVQQSMVALDRKVDASVGGVEKLSASVSANIENEALRVSRDITALSARMKADLKDTLAKEKERFAAQSADMETGRAVLVKRIEDMARQVSAAGQDSQSKTKAIAAAQADMKRLASDVSALRRS